jgi:hypothetical protein
MSESLGPFVQERITFVVKVVLCLVSELVAFVYWLFVAWLAEKGAHLAETNGVNEWVANVFRFGCSIGTLTLALLWIINDIVKEFRKLFLNPNKEGTHAH